MNKSIVAIAAAGLVSAIGFTSVASAEATVYGRVVAGAVHVDNDKANDDGAWNFGAVGHDGTKAPGSRIGFKGSTELGNGMEAGFKIERAIGKDATTQRHNHLYLSGAWGKLTLGQQDTPYRRARNWDGTNLYGGQFDHSRGSREEGLLYEISSGPFSFSLMAIANDTNIDTVDGNTSSTHDQDGDAMGLQNTREISCEPATSVVAATGQQEMAGCRAAFRVVTPGQAGDGDEAAYVADVEGDDGVDAWIIQAGYNFGPVTLNVAHQADNRDVEIGVATANATPGNVNQNAALAALDARGEAEAIAAANRELAGAVDTSSPTRDSTAIGINGSVGGQLDWYLAYEASELNTDNHENDVNSVGGFLGWRASDRDTLYAYHVQHSADRPTYDAAGSVTRGEDYTESVFGYSRQMGPGLIFIAEYGMQDNDLSGNNSGGDTNQLGLVVKYDF